MSEDIQNKNAASEDDLGTIHRLVTEGIKMRVGASVKKAKKTGKVDKLSMAELLQAGSWCRYNKVIGSASANKALGDEVDELAAIRARQRRNKITAVGED